MTVQLAGYVLCSYCTDYIYTWLRFDHSADRPPPDVANKSGNDALRIYLRLEMHFI